MRLRFFGADSAPAADEATSAARLRSMVDTHFDFVWRSVRRLGVPPEDADDAAQAVWLVAARRLADIAADRERAFLFGTAIRVAADVRRSKRRRPETAFDSSVIDVRDAVPDAHDLLEQRRARAFLDEAVAGLSENLRGAFVLFEMEELELAEIARMLDVPIGTVSSRLRRAREQIEASLQRFQRSEGESR